MNARHPTRLHVIVALAAALLTMLLAACGGEKRATPSASPQGTAPSGTAVAVAIQDYAYAPSTLTIVAGTAVTWTNNDSALHTVTSSDGPSTDAQTTNLFDSGMMAKGDTFTYTFDEPGTYDYLCTPHRSMAGMHAVVIVE